MTSAAAESNPAAESTIPEEVAGFRQRFRECEIGRFYSGLGHFAFTSLTSLTLIAFSLAGVRRPSVAELLTVPLTFLFANAVEYFGHKGPMHHRRRGLSLVYKRHASSHHHFYTDRAMALESARDLKMVLFPPLLIVFFFGLFALPIGLALALFATGNVARLFVATAVGYFLTYEWLHCAYHLPAGSRLGGLAAIARLRAHHQRHHNPRLMLRYNFNITFPICDYLLGTNAPRDH